VISDWTAQPDETVLHRARISYATGAAVPVSGSRWFRDSERNDIQRDLPGWPEGPEYTIHTPGQQAARWGGRFLMTGVPALIGAAIEALSGTGTPINPKTLGQPTERENEVDDFPVMWAAPGTIARTMPWQLDPARLPKDWSTHVVITDRRIVLLAQGPQQDNALEELRSISRDLISNVERMKFSHDENDIRIWFRDQSWIRIAIPNSEAGLLAHLRAAPLIVREDELNAAQRESVTKWLSRWPACDEPPLMLRLPSGNLMIQQRVPESDWGYGYLTQSFTFGADGAPAYDPQDY
jgi:hypothetical protein